MFIHFYSQHKDENEKRREEKNSFISWSIIISMLLILMTQLAWLIFINEFLFYIEIEAKKMRDWKDKIRVWRKVWVIFVCTLKMKRIVIKWLDIECSICIRLFSQSFCIRITQLALITYSMNQNNDENRETETT